MHRMKTIIAALLTMALSVSPALCKAEDMAAPEYRIKAAFLYNFARFISWPDSTTGNNGFSLCVLGSDPFGELLDSLSGKPVHKQELVIRRLQVLTPEDNCRLVYISSENTPDLDATLSLLKDQPVLTVSDMDDFTSRGGIIRFRLADKKVRFDINIDAANTAGLTISSKLLSLARIVRVPPDNGQR